MRGSGVTIYGVYRSRASRPLWLLHEAKSIAWTHVPVIQQYRVSASTPASMWTTTTPAFVAINPMAQVPAMTDGELVLTESMAITLHLASKAGPELGPRDAHEAALFNNWAFFGATNIDGPAVTILNAAKEPADKVAAALADIRRPLARLEAHLAARPAGSWLLDRFCAADICVAECVRYAQGNAELVAQFPAVFGWLKRCHERPAFKEVWAKRLEEPA